MKLINDNPWMIFFNSRCVEIFPHKEQAVIWCFEKKLVYQSNGIKWIDGRIKILQDY